MLEKSNLLGALLAHLIYVLCILVFVFRLGRKPQYEYWIGMVLLLTALPLGYLLLKAPQLERPPLYYVQISLMLVYLVTELVVDYWLKIDFRNTTWMVICYITLFFGGTGGMLGVAVLAGRGWIISAAAFWFLMSGLAIIQRAVTGM